MTDELDRAIEAAIKALQGAKVITSEHWTKHLARVAVTAAAPHLTTNLHSQVERYREVAAAARAFTGPVEHGFHDEDCQPDYVDEPEHCHPSCPQPRLRAALHALDLGAQQETTDGQK